MKKKVVLAVLFIFCGAVFNETQAEASNIASSEVNMVLTSGYVTPKDIKLGGKDNKAYEAAEKVIRDINTCNNLTDGEWDAIELSGLNLKYYDEILEMVEEAGNIYWYKISETIKSDNETTFILRVEKTIYLIQKGDTLSEIAQKEETTVEKLLELNPQISDPDLIYYDTFIKIK